MSEQKDTKIIVVTGDVTIDWNVARIQRRDVPAYGWNADDLTRACCQRGGAAMLADLIKAVAKDLGESKRARFEVRETNVPQDPVRPGDDRFHHSYATWAPFELDERNTSQKRKVWRVQEFLGLDRADTVTASVDDWKNVVDDPANPALIILDDANTGSVIIKSIGLGLCRAMPPDPGSCSRWRDLSPRVNSGAICKNIMPISL